MQLFLLKKRFLQSFTYLAIWNLIWTLYSQKIAKVKKSLPFFVVGNTQNHKDQSALGYSKTLPQWLLCFIKPQFFPSFFDTLLINELFPYYKSLNKVISLIVWYIFSLTHLTVKEFSREM